MYELLRWITILSASIIVGLVIAGLGIWCLGMSRKRRQARFVAELSAKYQSPGQEAEEPSQSVSVDELVARIESEGLPVRLNWESVEAGQDESGEWPTAVMPRLESDEEA